MVSLSNHQSNAGIHFHPLSPAGWGQEVEKADGYLLSQV
jgi:hypothetical protein